MKSCKFMSHSFLFATGLVVSTSLPGQTGWQPLLNTTLQSVCPPNNYQPAGGGMPSYAFNSNCHNVVDA